MKKKNERSEKKKRNPSGLEFSRVCWNAGKHLWCLVKYLQPAMLQLNIEETTTSKICMVERLAQKTKALIILLQETHCTCIDKLVIPNLALAGSIPSRKHGLATFVHESLSWSLAGQSPKDSEI